MRRFGFSFMVIGLCLLFCFTVCAAPRSGYTRVHGTYQKGNLTITSFSSNWTGKKIEALYNELLQNKRGWEFPYLKNIYLYPNSPINTAGFYADDIRFTNQGITFGAEAYIELFNMDSIPDAESVAATLAHEYGHHYTLYNISRYENKLHTQWRDSQYVQIRALDKYAVNYTLRSADNDVTEIAACDYVQLMGSPAAKKSMDYKDTKEMLELKESSALPRDYFNSMPQRYMSVPLAADVKGLYSYYLKIGGNTPEDLPATKPPLVQVIENAPSIRDQQYTLKFSNAEGNGPYEYTVVMYRPNDRYNPSPIKTVKDGEQLQAVFGTVYLEENKKVYAIFETYTGKYAFRVFAKDKDGFIHSSEPVVSDFGG